MKKEEVDLLVNQIRSIILNKPITTNTNAEDMADVQDAIQYLSGCLSEANEFLKSLANRELDTKVPSRHNFLTGNLKELHPGLQHLTWQAGRVAEGDYHQKVDFLGQFSDSFNSMVDQLKEREEKLKEQANALATNNNLLHAVIDSFNEWVIVIDKETNKVIYVNKAASTMFFDLERNKHICCHDWKLIDEIISHNKTSLESFEYVCNILEKVFTINSYYIKWQDRWAYVNCIIDITAKKKVEEQIKMFAYIDELTGLYNRRFCNQRLDDYINNGVKFNFCVIDIDGLKYANDAFGHHAGDGYLQEVAKELLSITRKMDYVCRLGGDEFGIIFKECGKKLAEEKMLKANLNIKSKSNEFPMSFSYGCSQFTLDSEKTILQIMEEADEKMYIQKRGKVV